MMYQTLCIVLLYCIITDRYSAVPTSSGVIVPSGGGEVAPVRGVAVLGRYIYVVRQGLFLVEVYGEKDLAERPKHQLIVQGRTVELYKPQSKTMALALKFMKKRKSSLVVTVGRK